MENSADNAAYVLFRQTGFNVVSELQSIAGHSDIVVTTKDSVFIFELKMDKGMEAEAAAEEALVNSDTSEPLARKNRASLTVILSHPF